MAHYGTRSSSSAKLTDEEWRAVCAYADEEIERIKPRNVPAYRATVLARRMEEVIDDRKMAKAFQAIIAAEPRRQVEAEVEPEIERNTGAALAAMRRGILDGRRQRAELLAKLEAEQARDHSWSGAR